MQDQVTEMCLQSFPQELDDEYIVIHSEDDTDDGLLGLPGNINKNGTEVFD